MSQKSRKTVINSGTDRKRTPEAGKSSHLPAPAAAVEPMARPSGEFGAAGQASPELEAQGEELVPLAQTPGDSLEAETWEADEATDTDDEGTMQGLLQEAEAKTQKLRDKEVTMVRVVQHSDDRVLVDVGEKLEGAVPADDFPPGCLPEVGSEIPVLLLRRGSVDKHAVVSYRKARELLGWKGLLEAFSGKRRILGTITKAVRGGFLVDIDGVSAFMPLSLTDRKPLKKGETLVGKAVECVILEVEPENKRVVVSRRQVLEEEYLKKKRARIAAFRIGQVIEGRVSSLTSFGAFVDLGGVEGMVHLSDLSWKPVSDPKEVLKKGQKVKVRVIQVQPEELRLSLGYKQLQPNPIEALRRRYRIGAKVRGKVLSVSEKGVLLELAPDVKGFVPSRDFEERARRGEAPPPPRPMTQKPGEMVGAVVVGVDERTFELNLSLRKFDQIEERETVNKYLRGAPKLTLGDLLKPGGE